MTTVWCREWPFTLAMQVCVGGDGSLTGANMFKLEWPGYVKELIAAGELRRYARTDAECSLCRA
jgi:hypothetical protein